MSFQKKKNSWNYSKKFDFYKLEIKLGIKSIIIPALLLCAFTTFSAFAAPVPKAGDIFYADGTVSAKVLKKKTPAGVVLTVTKSGQVEKILSLSEAPDYTPFAAKGNLGYLAFLETDKNDGSKNWEPLVKVDFHLQPENLTSEYLAENYPAWSWCKALRDGGFDDWYLPASNEMAAFYRNLSAIEATLTKLKASCFKDAVCIPEEFAPEWRGKSIWMKTSTQCESVTVSTFELNLRKGKLEDHHEKSRGAVVRAVRKVN